MSEQRELKIVNVNVEPETARLKLTLDDGSIVYITDVVAFSLCENFPEKTTEQRIKEIIEKIHQVRIRRVQEFEHFDKLLEELDKKHEDVCDELAKVTSKEAVLKYGTIVKSLAARKAIIQERRHVLKLTHIEEGDLRSQLAKLQRGEPSEKRERA